jgi:ABC-type sugar transport system substrate-binding protein
MNGALDYIKARFPYPGRRHIREQGQAESAYNYTKDMLTAHPDLKVVYVTAGGPFGRPRQSRTWPDRKVGIVCYDHIPDNAKYVKSGEIVAAIAQDPFGQASIPASTCTIISWESRIPRRFHPCQPRCSDPGKLRYNV